MIALAVRGGGYEREWASNFTIGAYGLHQGFTEARDQVLQFLHDYISDKKISGNIKIWITGYSRAAATANLVAGAIDGGIKFRNCTLNLADLYAYTFETPAGTMGDNTKGVYGNIFNIINYNDPLPKVAPVVWSFTRFGKNCYLPSKIFTSEKKYPEDLEKMLRCYNTLENMSDYIVDNFSMKKISVNGWAVLPGGKPFVSIIDDINNKQTQSAFLDDYIIRLVKEFVVTRSNYVSRYQEGIRDMCGLFFGADEEQSQKLFSSAADKFKNNWGWIIWELLRPFGGEEAAYEKIAEYLRESLDDAGITSYTEKEFDNAVKALLDLVAAVATNHPNLTTTLVMNIEGIGSAHDQGLCLAWLQSMDSNYTCDGAASFASGAYRIIRINCPVDIEVYNDRDDLVAQIISDEPRDVGSSIVSALNEDGEKLIYLPATADYRIKIAATQDGEMTYSVNEYSPEAGEITRVVNYYNIPLTTGAEFLAYVPACNQAELEDGTGNGSTSEYPLSLQGREIEADTDLKGEEATEAYFMVEAKSENENYGMVTGQGVRQIGNYAKINAIAYDGCAFAGWYIKGIKVSSDVSYRFLVTSDIKVSAKFTGTSIQSLTVDAIAEEGGTVLGGGTYNQGEDVTLTATPNTGYRFAGWYINSVKVSSDESYQFAAESDVKIIAKFRSQSVQSLTVDAIAEAGGTVLGGGTYNQGTEVTLTAVPDTGYCFAGWYENDVKIDGAGPTYRFSVTSSRTLEAWFVPNHPVSVYTVTFDSKGGSAVVSKTGVVSGSRIKKPVNPKKTGYTFAGWYKEKGCKKKWNFNKDIVTKNTILYAKWKAKNIKLTYDAGKGKIGKKKTCVTSNSYGKPIKLAQSPVRKGYKFNGWFTRKADGTKITKKSWVPSAGRTYYARWVKIRKS